MEHLLKNKKPEVVEKEKIVYIENEDKIIDLEHEVDDLRKENGISIIFLSFRKSLQWFIKWKIECLRERR